MEKIIEFFKLSVLFGEIAKSAISGNKSVRKKTVTMANLHATEAGLLVTFTREMAILLFEHIAKKVVLKDNSLKTRASLSIPARLDREEDTLFFPLVSIDMEPWREEILEAIKSSNKVTITVPWETELLPNKVLLESGFFTSSVDFFEKLEDGKEYKTLLGNLVPEKARTSGKPVIASVLEYFQPEKVSGFQMKLPTMETPKHPAFVMFGMEQDFMTKRMLDEVLNNPSPAVVEYLLGNTKKSETKPAHMLGHFAPSYPLGEGQYQASVEVVGMITGESDQLIHLKFGPAGTGKSTALHTDMASIETWIALSIMEGKLIKPNLLTATAQKAIEGLVDGFATHMSGIVYMGGNAKRKEAAKADNDKLISELLSAEADMEKLTKLQKTIATTVKQLKRRESFFRMVKEVNLKADFRNLKEDLLKQAEVLKTSLPTKEEMKALNESIYAIMKIAGIKEEEVISFIEANKSEISLTAKKIEKDGLFKSFFSGRTLELENGKKVDDKSEILLLDEIVNSIDIESFKSYSGVARKKLSVIEELIPFINTDTQDDFIGMIVSESWEEYSRQYCYKLTNKLSYTARKLNREVAVQNKEEVVRAIQFFSDENPYRYLRREYPSVADQKQFLHWVALVYPFMGATLASCHAAFPGLEPEIRPFNFTIADEAGMITVIDMLKPLQLSEKAIIVGDPYQLQPIFPVEKLFENALKKQVEGAFWEKYSPTVVSAFHRAAGVDTIHEGTGKAVLLNEHRRCHKDIAGLFKQLIPAYSNLEVKTPKLKGENLEKFEKIGNAFMFLNVESKLDCQHTTNLSEVNYIDKLLSRVEAAGYDLTKDVGIITPYKAQADLLEKRFSSRLAHSDADQKIGTVHAFQGAEYKVIIFSAVVSKETDSLEFINNGAYLMNVAISRAKSHFLMVGDYKKVTSVESNSNYIGKVAKLMKEKNLVFGVK